MAGSLHQRWQVLPLRQSSTRPPNPLGIEKTVSKPEPPQAKTPPLLQADNLSCQFGGKLAIEQLSLTLTRGEVLGLVGLNGAGKSTTLRMLCGLLAPTTGTVQIAGHSLIDEPAEARRQLGYLPDPPSLHDCLNVSEAIDINARLHGLNKADRRTALERVLEQCQLEEVKNKRIKALSKGYRQRTGLALALAHNPSVLILDEPASGLDPAQTQHLNRLIKNLTKDRAIIFSSHSIADVQNCCTRVALLQNGKLAQDHQRDPENKLNTASFKLKLREVISAKSLLALPCVIKAKAVDTNTWLIQLNADNPDAIVAAVLANNWGLRALSPQRDNMSAVLNQLRTTTDLEAA